MSDSLEHYGILGMKWGVRRTPEQLGHHSIPKGTKVYRVSAESKQTLSGATYVTYLPPDRDLYRGNYSEALRRNQGAKKSDRMVENEYELTQDLNIPSRKEVAEVMKKTMMDSDLKRKACEGLAKELVDSDRFDYFFNWGDEAEKQMMEDVKYFTESYLKDFGSYTPDEAFNMTARSLGAAHPAVKKSVIDQLKARGYNAMVDEAGVGGLTVPREGVEPLILFDGGNQLQKIGQNEITKRSMKAADKRYDKWNRTANRHRDQPW